MVAGGPLRPSLSVTCLLVLEGDDSDFYHREMNSDCSPAFRALGDGECQYKHNGIFRAATPPLIHSNGLIRGIILLWSVDWPSASLSIAADEENSSDVTLFLSLSGDSLVNRFISLDYLRPSLRR